MTQIVLMQVLVTIIASFIGLGVGGLHVGVSSLLGGMCCVVPNALFALYLVLAVRKNKVSVATFFQGEFIKIILTIVLFATIVLLYRDMHWLAFIVSFIVVFKSYLILLLRQRL